MKDCTVCKKQSSAFLLNNRFVCFHCDELLFDIEIESDEAEVAWIQPRPTAPKSEPVVIKPTGQK